MTDTTAEETVAHGGAVGGRRRRGRFDVEIEQLLKTRTGAAADTVAELCSVLEQIHRVSCGEVRIAVSGAVSSLKSTTVELLLGRPGLLAIDEGAITPAPTEVRLAQVDDPVPPRQWICTMTESTARRRAVALLGLPPETDLSLAELAGTGGDNDALVAQLVAATSAFDYGATYSAEEFARRGGVLRIDGFGTALVERVVVELAVPRAEWDLSWAGRRAVTVVDLPGTGKGRALENLINEQRSAVAHIALNVVGLAAGNDFEAPPAHAMSACVLVATRLDSLGSPGDPAVLHNLESAVATTVRDWQVSGRQAEVAAVCGPWACASAEQWARFSPNAEAWVSAERARDQWTRAPWTPTGPTRGALREAVSEALFDGGTRRLRELVERLAARSGGRVDEAELTRLMDRAARLVGVLRDNRSATRTEDWAVHARLVRLRGDQTPIDRMRRLARRAAEDAVYGMGEWDRLRPLFLTGRWSGSVPRTRSAFEKVGLAEVAAAAIDVSHEALEDLLDEWGADYGLSLSPPAFDEDRARAEAARFGELGARLLSMMTDGRFGGDSGDALTLRWVARTRLELATLLEGLLVHRMAPSITAAWAEADVALAELVAKATPASSGVGTLRMVERKLDELRRERSRGGR
ncbi:hypothetical protein V5P93_003399 [Actinokineospora auranticolor]|uniref:Dynamin family protein n=1 Tax=Actinokineospora auranticolor TaxID=155976 RepID=A0A2S6GPF9_9PSEU|nr:hypothetical protein [Actinokineospora auranticolor]PPK67060.1 hypothetical protein CLV40_10857 [Actinokineospora auranticolor]